MTEKLFYQDSHLSSFEATVISCESHQENYMAVLDRTAFFPEGGGQGADHGKLNDVNVFDVQEKDGIIYHYIDDRIEPGTKVKGQIDWKARYSKMQQHTGEHIVSGLIHSHFGYNNVGFHLGDELCTLDLSGPMTKEELTMIEELANEAVYKDLKVQELYPTKEELKNIQYRSKIEIEGQVRIVVIPGYDTCACCAPHVKTTGEIGMIKFIHSMNYKGGVRITMVCGSRALKDYQKKDNLVKDVMFELSSKEELVGDAVRHLKDENSTLKNEVAQLQKEILRFKVQMIPEGKEKICIFEEELSGNAPRELMNLILDRNVKICGVFTGNDKSGYRYVIGSRNEDVRELGKTLNQEFDGRGGGKPEMVQGSLKGNKQEIEKAFLR